MLINSNPNLNPQFGAVCLAQLEAHFGVTLKMAPFTPLLLMWILRKKRIRN